GFQRQSRPVRGAGVQDSRRWPAWTRGEPWGRDERPPGWFADPGCQWASYPIQARRGPDELRPLGPDSRGGILATRLAGPFPRFEGRTGTPGGRRSSGRSAFSDRDHAPGASGRGTKRSPADSFGGFEAGGFDHRPDVPRLQELDRDPLDDRGSR